MKKYLIVDTWNGEGYSDSNAEVVEYGNIQDAMDYAKGQAINCSPNNIVELSISPTVAFIYNYGEDDGAIHITEYDEETTGVIIMPCINHYEVITDYKRLKEVESKIILHEDFNANDKQIYGQCYDCMEDDNDWILISEEMLLEKCCDEEDNLEWYGEAENDTEAEIWKCKKCDSEYNIPIEIVRDWDSKNKIN